MKYRMLLALSLCMLHATPSLADVKYVYTNPGKSVTFTFTSPTYFDFSTNSVLYLDSSWGYSPPVGTYQGPLGTTLVGSVGGSQSTLVTTYDSSQNTVFSYFLNSDFYNLGTHASIAWDPATLEVSQVQSPAPESPLWVMLIAGFGSAGAALRRRRERKAFKLA